MKRIVFISLALLAAVTVFGAIAVTRNHYYDYHVADCSTQGFTIRAELRGEFGENHPDERSNPYYLRLEIAESQPSFSRSSDLHDLTLTSILTAKQVALENPVRFDGASNAAIYLVESIDIPFENYELTGNLNVRTPNNGRVQIQCKLRTNYSEEWRFSWWDKFLSV